MNAARIDLMASAAGKIGGVTWHHLYLVATDGAGKQVYLRAGPQCLPREMIAGRIRPQEDTLDEDDEPRLPGPYGVITFLTGAYEPGGIDFDPLAANVTLASGNAAAALWEKLQGSAQALQAEQTAYDPVEKGANWALMEALRRCGMQPVLPPKRWAPGAGAVSTESGKGTGPTRRVGDPVLAGVQ